MTTTGTSVLDFVMVPHEQMHYNMEFNVLGMTNTIHKHD